MAKIKPIETYYNGYYFRSRLEARWAVFFDAAEIKYQYEPEGFELSDGTRYLPDFYLPEVEGRCGKGLWVDVKSGREEEDLSKVERFALEVAQIAVLYPFDGDHENIYYYHHCDYDSNDPYCEMTLGESDSGFYFVKCPQCNIVSYESCDDKIKHSKDCDKRFYKYCKMADDLKRYIISEAKDKSRISCDIDTVDRMVQGLYLFKTKFHEHTDHFQTAANCAKQARFEFGECGKNGR